VSPPRPGWSLHLPESIWHELANHLFLTATNTEPSILAGRSHGPRGPRLLGRSCFIARDSVDYVPGVHGYRGLSASSSATPPNERTMKHLAVHRRCTPLRHRDRAFSSTDSPAISAAIRPRAAHRQLVGGLVLTPCAAAADLWLPGGGREEPPSFVIPGYTLQRLHSSQRRVGNVDAGGPGFSCRL